MLNEIYPNYLKNFTRSSITVVLLDGNRQTLAYDKTTKLSSLFETTCEYCNVDSDNLFGFAVLIDDYFAFLDLNWKVSKINFKEYSKKSQKNILFQKWSQHPTPKYPSPVHQSSFSSNQNPFHKTEAQRLVHSSQHSTQSAPPGSYATNNRMTGSGSTLEDEMVPRIYFRVKSYVHPHCLRDRNTKILYFQQLLRNVLDYRMVCPDETYFQLATYGMQVYYGGGSSTLDGQQDNNSNMVFQPHKFLPNHILVKFGTDFLATSLTQLHSENTSSQLTKFQAIMAFIRLASESFFNLHLFPVRLHSTPSSYSEWLGLSPSGLELFHMHSNFLIHRSTLKWPEIDSLAKKPSRINVKLGRTRLKMHTETKMEADHLIYLIRSMHMYQKTAQFNATQTLESIRRADRQMFREKYVYVNEEDHQMHRDEELDQEEDQDNQQQNVIISSYRVSEKGKKLPTNGTPAVPPRRQGSKARPTKMKEMMGVSDSWPLNGEDSSRDSGGGTYPRKPQYLKKHQQQLQHQNGGGVWDIEDGMVGSWMVQNKKISNASSEKRSVSPPPPVLSSLSMTDDEYDEEFIESPGVRKSQLDLSTLEGSSIGGGGRFICLADDEEGPQLSIPSPPSHRRHLSDDDEDLKLEDGRSNLLSKQRLWRSDNMLHLDQLSSLSSDGDDDNGEDDSIEISSLSS